MRAFVASSGTDRLTVHLAGEIDLAAAARLKALTEQIASESSPPREIAVDLAEVTFLDSTGLSFVAALHRLQLGHGGEVVLLSPQQPVRRVLDVTGMTFLVAGSVPCPRQPPGSSPG